ncbi:hypothetical protein T492DRAFT_1037641 [Pavlovales sp. CCMP2436]|nr:hypothetical protein T492DRAFT_1037641 [Pavlovales sp. CCMP2436]
MGTSLRAATSLALQQTMAPPIATSLTTPAPKQQPAIDSLAPRRGVSTSFVVSRFEDGVLTTALVSEARLRILLNADTLAGDSAAALELTMALAEAAPASPTAKTGHPEAAASARKHASAYTLLVQSIDEGDIAGAAALRAERLMQSLLAAKPGPGIAPGAPGTAPGPESTPQHLELMKLFAKADKCAKSLHDVPEDYGGIVGSFLRMQRDRSEQTRRNFEARLESAGVPLPDLPPGLERGFAPILASSTYGSGLLSPRRSLAA